MTDSPSTEPGAERRQHVRKPLRGTAHLLFPGYPPLPIRTVDLSKGGLGAAASANPRLNLTCKIRFSVPTDTGGSTAIETDVQVAHSVLSSSHGEFIVGLRFTRLSPEASELIARFVER